MVDDEAAAIDELMREIVRELQRTPAGGALPRAWSMVSSRREMMQRAGTKVT
jgi:hypothetical protein